MNMYDDEDELMIATSERAEALGYKPQKEILVNHILPYADELDEESARFLEQVKTNLAKAVMLREMKPACGVWSSRLMKYIRIYGLKFSKEDHIAFIKLVYELIVIPDLEPCKVHKFIALFLMLTKQRYLVSRDELTLPWRPLYETGKKIFDKNSTHIGMYHYLTSLETSYTLMVKDARTYFELSATKEILAEFLPQISPWSSDSTLKDLFAVFLPVSLPPELAAHGHELWFDQLMTLWDTCHNSHGISDLMLLFGGLAKRNPGSIDWTPHVPKMFAKFLNALNLPVSYKDVQYSRNNGLDMRQVALWIVWTINPDGVVLKHLRSFLAGIESYLHSVNSGRWSYKLRDLLRKLAREFLNRVRCEREKRSLNSWENKTPESYKLRDEDITEFVTIVMEPTLQAVYNRTGSLDISHALQNLATLRPALVVPPLLEKLRTSLTSLTEPHRVTAAMFAVAAVARPMTNGAELGYPEGPTHVIPLLMAVLPGLDPNDIKKTLVTLNFILIFSWMVPYIDCSSAHEYYNDLTEEELLTCESTAQLEDFVLVFLDRLFVIIESCVLEHVRLDTKESDAVRSKTDAVMEQTIASAATTVLMQCSPKIFKEALRKFKAFATESTFETNVSGSMVGMLLRVFARVDSEATAAAFIPKLCEELTELLATDEQLQEENPPRDLVYRLVLLSHAVECDGVVLLKYLPQIIPILDRALKLHSNYALSRACDILSHVFTYLSCIELKEWRAFPEDYGAAPEKWLPVRQWGKGCWMKESKFKWHTPNDDEAKAAQDLLNRYMKPEVARFRQWLSGERTMCRERRFRSFHILNAVLSCSTFLPPPDEGPVHLLDSEVPATSIPFTNGVRHTVTLDGENVRVALTNLMLDVQARMLTDKTDDTRGLEMLIQVWERIVVMKGIRTGFSLEASRLRSYGLLERSGAAKLRMLVAEATRVQDEARLELVCEAGITPSALKALHALYELAINTYSTVRMLSQVRLYWMLNHYPYSYRMLVPKIAQLLAEGGEGDEWHARHKGALYIMLGPRTGPLIAKQDWEVVRTLWPAILKAPLSEKPSILRLEQAFRDCLHHQFPLVNTWLTMTDSVVEAAKYFLTQQQLNDPVFVKQLNGAVAKEVDMSDHRTKLYHELIDELVDVCEAPNAPWRRLELAMQMLSFSSSVQTKYPPRAIRLMVRSLLHDDIAVRRTAQRLTHYLLKQRKHPLKKIEVDPYEVAGIQKPEMCVRGYRKDLEWAIWSEDRIPKTDEEWDRPWLRNYMYGFYAWPEKLQVAAPSSEQVTSADIRPEDMEEGERYVHEFFIDDANIDKLVAFLTVEEKKGKDKFNGTRFSVFKLLFAQFGEQIANKVLKHAYRCASDSAEAPQRFAAEVAAAALRAPRYWPRTRALNMHRQAFKIIEAGLTSVTPETMEDWGTCLATGVEKMDPHRGGEVLSSLVEFCLPPPAQGDADPDRDTSFVVCARLYALQGILGSLTWRAAPLSAQVLRRLEAANFIQHPYQNVREVVGSILVTIFNTELVLPGGDAGPAPRLEEFLASVRPRLAALYDENGDIMITTAASIATVQCSARDEASVCPEPEIRPSAPMVGQVAQVTVDVARLSPDEPIPDDAPSTSEGGEPTEGEVVSRGERMAKQLVTRLDTALRLTGDATTPAPRDHARAVSLLTTVLRACMGMVVRGLNSGSRARYSMVEAACAVAGRGWARPHDELPRAATGFLASLALAHHDQNLFDTALQVVDHVAAGRSWWARLACLDFAQPLLFYGLPMLCDCPQRATRAEQLALKLMRDPRLEVRQSAAKLLTGLMHCRALPDENQTLRRLTRSCRSKDLVERHCGVLGLCAYLSSRPYSLGPKLGDVLTELARHTNASDPIPATIRTALADFRRTHQDDWPRHREELTEEELDLLADLTSPPSYCA